MDALLIRHFSAQPAFKENALIGKVLRLLSIVSIVGIILIIVGGSNTASAGNDISKLNSAANLRHVGSILFVVLFTFLTLVHLYFWANRDMILQHRRKVHFPDICISTRILNTLL